MKLHEIEDINPQTSVLRVIGGWIYTISHRGVPTSVFVPFVEEEVDTIETSRDINGDPDRASVDDKDRDLYSHEYTII